ncbi:MAG: PhoX family protein [Gammaproteobacteria bacterium]|nr:PhoX family protein [Gammaproteobacteria bacterium]MDH5617290.1 PhoX family protein [Gammaproteobacteria bacterium]
MLNRRRFLQSLAAAAFAPAVTGACAASRTAQANLVSDPDRILDLPPGFGYSVVSKAGTQMSDGLQVPGKHDGMAAFDGADGRIRLVCNHEIRPEDTGSNSLRKRFSALPEEARAKFYDRGGDRTPGLGGTTTTIYDPQSAGTERQFLSLGGTELNCAGGPTPWGSWLSCEECFEWAGDVEYFGVPAARRDQKHGYVFEVPAAADELVQAIPLTGMGRFEHEACAVDEATGIVYMTEDRHHSLFYRYVPNVPGKLLAGGKLQALVVDGQPSLATHNWTATPSIRLGEPLAAGWIDFDDPNPFEDTLRHDGAMRGAATFARGEGLCVAGDRFAFTCTNGGPARLGQVFTYKPTSADGGELELIAESQEGSLLRNADNLTMAPWGDLIVCEDTSGHCGLVGIRPDGSQYAIADNAHSSSELAGVCFSPDGEILFVNIQYPGMTIAITGNWKSLQT